MRIIRRVTLRCICEDLDADWGNPGESRAFLHLRKVVNSECFDSEVALALECVPTTSLAAHPLIAGFHAAFEGNDPGLQRETISGLSDPYWLKQKTSRWRGAATDADVVGEGEVWLCAGGLRASGDARDFYARFMQGSNAERRNRYLPDASDRRLQAVEAKLARRDAWLEQVRLSVLICLHKAYLTNARQALHVPPPAPRTVDERFVHIVLEVVRVGHAADEMAEVSLTIQRRDFSKPALFESAMAAARSVIEPSAEEWRVLPGKGNDQIWATLIDDDVVALAKAAFETGSLPARLVGSTPIGGLRAHYTPKDGIVGATVKGDPVRGLCGSWFVPTSDPDAVPVCDRCTELHAGLSD